VSATKDRRKSTGARGEAIAAQHLERNGFSIVETNWRRRIGEIDIVARDGAALVFVEVRTRRSNQVGAAEESITAVKQRRLADLAQLYLQVLESTGRPWAGPWRIDVVAVAIDPRSGEVAGLNHLVNAIEGE